jgi:hypothetical protein
VKLEAVLSPETTVEPTKAMSDSPQVMSELWNLRSHDEALSAFVPNSANVKSHAADTHEVGVALEMGLPITTMERLLPCIGNVSLLLQHLRGDFEDFVFELAVGYDILPFVNDESGDESFCGCGSKV